MPERQPLQESDAQFTVWVCARGECDPSLHTPTPQRRIPFCSCRIESKRGGLGAAFRYVDRVPLNVVPRSVAEALAEALRRINGGVPYWAPMADAQRIAREAWAEYRAAYPKETP